MISLPSTHSGSFHCLQSTALARGLIPVPPLTAGLAQKASYEHDHSSTLTTKTPRAAKGSRCLAAPCNPETTQIESPPLSLRATLLLQSCYPLVCGGTEEKGKTRRAGFKYLIFSVFLSRAQRQQTQRLV